MAASRGDKRQPTDSTSDEWSGSRQRVQLLRDERSGSSGSAQGDAQGGREPDMTSILQEDNVDVESGAGRSLLAVRNIGHTADSLESTSRSNSAVAGTTRGTGTNNLHTVYDHARHTEIPNARFYGPVSFAHSLRSTAQTRKSMENLVQTQIDWSNLSSELSYIGQDEYQSTISPFDNNDPKYSWITGNIDFMQWKLADTPRALLISASHDHTTKELCQHVIELAKKKVSQMNGSVLYFFSSCTANDQSSTVLIHTLLRQVACLSDGKSNSIATAFLASLVGAHFQPSQHLQHRQVFRVDDPLPNTVQKLLEAPHRDLVEALGEAIKRSGIQELSVIIDGLQENIVCLLFEVMRKAVPKSEFLFTSQYQFGELRHGITYIECDKERKECLRCLQHGGSYNKISNEHRNSLEWIWEHRQYQEWSASKTSSLLYIEGKPGSGKSTLAKYFAKNLLDREPNAHLGTVAHYFYTFRGTQLQRTHVNMLRAVLHSILEQDDSKFFHFQREFRKFPNLGPSEWPYDSLKNVLSSLATHPSTKPLYLILDAMDESKETDRRDIIKLLCELCSKESGGIIKAFLASRPLPELDCSLQESHHVIKMQDENTNDISRFANDFLTRDLKLTGNILLEAREYITKHAQGVFVWVGLVIKELQQAETGLSHREILELIKELPRELEELYGGMFRRLKNNDPRDVRVTIRLFRFVLVALRPLTVEELRDALAVPDDHNPDYEKFVQSKIHDIARRIAHCGGGFLEINAGGTVQFMHQTAREFLIRKIRRGANLKFDLREEGANEVITTTLVRYLTIWFTSTAMRDRFSKIVSWSLIDHRAYAEYLNEWPLIHYALHHIKLYRIHGHQKGSDLELVTALVQRLTDNRASCFLGSFMGFQLRENEAPVHGYQAASEDIKYNTLNAAAEPPDLPHAIALLLTCTQDDGHTEGKTPLIISAQKGLAAAARLLLNQNVDKDAQDDSRRTALHYAANNCDEAIIRLLVDHGAKRDIRDDAGKIALHKAASKIISSDNDNRDFVFRDFCDNDDDGNVVLFFLFFLDKDLVVEGQDYVGRGGGQSFGDLGLLRVFFFDDGGDFVIFFGRRRIVVRRLGDDDFRDVFRFRFRFRDDVVVRFLDVRDLPVLPPLLSVLMP